MEPLIEEPPAGLYFGLPYWDEAADLDDYAFHEAKDRYKGLSPALVHHGERRASYMRIQDAVWLYSVDARRL